MKILKLVLIIPAILVTNYLSFAQSLSSSISNNFQFGTGFENFGEGGFVSKIKKEYFENYTDARFFLSNFTLGFRLEVSNPPEYGLPYKGIRKKYIEFEKEGLSIRAGDLYTLFSRGLSLNLFEERPLGYDSNLEGIKIGYSNSFLKSELVGGDIDFLVPSTILTEDKRIEKYKIRAASLRLIPADFFSFGGNFVWSENKLPNIVTTTDTTIVKIPEYFFRLNLFDFDLYASYATKFTSISGKDSSRGSAFYSSLTHSGDGFGITFEYKDYRFDIVDQFLRSDPFRSTAMLSFQNPPIVHKEHLFSLLKRYPHITDFNDEVGFQIDAFLSLNSQTTLNGNIAISSRHYEYELDPKTFKLNKIKSGSSLFPSLSEKRDPFWEIYFDVEYILDDNFENYIRLAFNRRSATVYDILNPLSKIQPTRLTTIPMEIQHVLSGSWSLKFISESQWVKRFPISERYFNQLFAIAVSKSPSISLGIKWEFTSSDFEPESKKNWIIVEGSYRFGTNHLLILAFGDERGGVVCSNGICRQVYPFSGFRMTLTSNI